MDRNPIVFVFLVVLAVYGIAGFAVYGGVRAHDIALIGFVAFGTIIVFFAAAVLYQIANGSITLAGIISEPKGTLEDKDGEPKASLSRFQFLVFTFVVAGLFLMLSIEAGQFVNIPNNVLVLIGLSGTGYLASKVANPAPQQNIDAAPSENTKDLAEKKTDVKNE